MRNNGFPKYCTVYSMLLVIGCLFSVLGCTAKDSLFAVRYGYALNRLHGDIESTNESEESDLVSLSDASKLNLNTRDYGPVLQIEVGQSSKFYFAYWKNSYSGYNENSVDFSIFGQNVISADIKTKLTITGTEFGGHIPIYVFDDLLPDFSITPFTGFGFKYVEMKMAIDITGDFENSTRETLWAPAVFFSTGCDVKYFEYLYSGVKFNVGSITLGSPFDYNLSAAVRDLKIYAGVRRSWKPETRAKKRVSPSKLESSSFTDRGSSSLNMTPMGRNFEVGAELGYLKSFLEMVTTSTEEGEVKGSIGVGGLYFQLYLCF